MAGQGWGEDQVHEGRVTHLVHDVLEYRGGVLQFLPRHTFMREPVQECLVQCGGVGRGGLDWKPCSSC